MKQLEQLLERIIDRVNVNLREFNFDAGAFDFKYAFPPEVLERYVRPIPHRPPAGALIDFVNAREPDLEAVFNTVRGQAPIPVPPGAALSRYAARKGAVELDENVLVAQRAYLEHAKLGRGANVQENRAVINSTLHRDNVTAHGGKIVNAQMGEKVFVGFNAFIQGQPGAGLEVERDCIIMPHTIIDATGPIKIPAGRLVWGHVRRQADLDQNSLALKDLAAVKTSIQVGGMTFHGDGAAFVRGFTHRIEHILEANGAYFDGHDHPGHAQTSRHINYATLQPYPEGDRQGLFPEIEIRP